MNHCLFYKRECNCSIIACLLNNSADRSSDMIDVIIMPHVEVGDLISILSNMCFNLIPSMNESQSTYLTNKSNLLCCFRFYLLFASVIANCSSKRPGALRPLANNFNAVLPL